MPKLNPITGFFAVCRMAAMPIVGIAMSLSDRRHRMANAIFEAN